MRALIAGGGTGGHLYPGIAVAEAMAELDPSAEIHFAGTSYGIEARVVPELGWPLHVLAVRGMPRRLSPRLLGAAARLPVSLVQALALVGRVRPRVVVGTGGYASAPAVAAALMLRVPVVLLEQNLAPGMTTRRLARWAREVHVSFPETEARLPGARVRVSGNPIRRAILSATREEAVNAWGLDPARRTLVVFGGSRGARGLNALVAAALPLLGDAGSWQCLWQAGADECDAYAARCSERGMPVIVRPFIPEVGPAYAAADLVLCRAGATTVAELTARGLPSILVPYPWAASAHQEENARWMETRGASLVFPEATTRPEALADTVTRLFRDPAARLAMSRASSALGHPRAAETVARAALALSAARRE